MALPLLSLSCALARSAARLGDDRAAATSAAGPAAPSSLSIRMVVLLDRLGVVAARRHSAPQRITPARGGKFPPTINSPWLACARPAAARRAEAPSGRGCRW